MEKIVRVRFAPSPTGFLHVGGARTALYNWLFARHHKGVFVLRIEDTDQVRSTPEAVQAILDGMRWLGLDWDEGPYFQSQRLSIYNEHIERLQKSGGGYWCFCSPEELDAERKAQQAQKLAPRYGGKCRKLSGDEVAGRLKENRPHVLRFKMPATGTTIFEDAIRGKVSFKNDLLEDFVLVKSDGFPTYNFAAVVDDHLMEMTHIIRGDDHISNTPRQVLLYKAFEWDAPTYAHIPMILGADKTRLSKRHGATSVIAYKEMGYLPEVMINYLAKLGWGHGDQEIFTRDELVEKFTLEKVGKVGAIFNVEKLAWMNGYYIRRLSPEKLLPHVEPLLEKAFPDFSKMLSADRSHVLDILRQLQERLRTFPEMVPLSEYFFTEDYSFDEKDVNKHMSGPEEKAIIKEIQSRLEGLDSFSKDAIEVIFKTYAEEKGWKLGKVIHPVRVALTGRAQSPPMYDLVELIGREKVRERLTRAVEMIPSNNKLR